jgi:predicted RNA binding protein YcfA (HicA-like mRNA interferase family)
MSRLPALKYRDVVACLRRRGFEYVRPGKGSHEFWINRRTRRVTMVACHPGDIPRGTLRAIIAQTGLTAQQFLG